MNLKELIKSNLNNAETASTKNMFIDKPIIRNIPVEESYSDDLLEMGNIVNKEITISDLIPQLTDLKSLINSNLNNLRYIKNVSVDSIEDISLKDGILILKAIEGNKEIIQIYKGMHKFMVPDLPIEYLKLYGENGYLIKYQDNRNYHWRLYNLKYTAYLVLFCQVEDEYIPIYLNHFSRTQSPKFIITSDFILLDRDTILDKINDNQNFNPENYCVLYSPLYRQMSKLTSKKKVFEIFQNNLNKYMNVSHSIRIIDAMIKTL